MEENIDEIRRKVVTEIKDKVRKNPGYAHPCNKERQEDMKRLKFASGNDFTRWMQQNGILVNPTDIKRKELEKTIKDAECKTCKEYRDKCAQSAGFENDAVRRRDYYREWTHNAGISIPMEFDEECESHIGVCIGEDEIGRRMLDVMFEEVDKKKNNNPKYEFFCKNFRQKFVDRYPQFKLERNKEYKIDVKTAHFLDECWHYNIYHNDVADYFLLIALETTGDICLYIWFIHKNEMIRERKFWKRVSIKINKNNLSEFKKYALICELETLKEIDKK